MNYQRSIDVEIMGSISSFLCPQNDLGPSVQCDCYRSGGEVADPSEAAKLAFLTCHEAVYYWNREYNFNITYIQHFSSVSGAHRPLGWRHDKPTLQPLPSAADIAYMFGDGSSTTTTSNADRLQECNASTAEYIRTVDIASFVKVFLEDVGLVDEVVRIYSV